jgi:hypothetical protein
VFWPAEKCRISSDISVQLISCLIQNLTGANTAGLVIPELIRHFSELIRQRSNRTPSSGPPNAFLPAVGDAHKSQRSVDLGRDELAAHRTLSACRTVRSRPAATSQSTMARGSTPLTSSPWSPRARAAFRLVASTAFVMHWWDGESGEGLGDG